MRMGMKIFVLKILFLYTSDCTSTFLKQIYPESYGQKLWPARPYNYELQPFDRQYSNGRYYPGIKVDLSPPNTASVTSVRGFEIDFNDIEDSRIEAQRCLIIDLRNITLTADDRGIESRATVDIYPLSSKTFIFDLFSLPKPPSDEITSDLHHLSFVKTGKYGWSPGDPSDQWITTIFYRNISTSRKIDFIFSPPPEEYNFVYFDVKLWKIDNPGVNRSNEIRHLIQSDVIFNQTWYTFENVTPSFYRVSVSPRDHLFPTSDCVCKNRDDHCTNDCFTTVTNVFEIRSLIPLTLSSDVHTTKPHGSTFQSIETTDIFQNSDWSAVTTETFEESPTIQKTSYGQDDTKYIIGITIGVTSVILLTICVIMVICAKRRKNAHNIDNQFESSRNTRDFIDTVSEGYKKDERRLISTKTIHMAFARDHPLHYEVVKTFAKFLTTHAYCDVVNFSEEYNDILNNIEDADKVLIINSEVAFQHYEAWKDRESCMGDGNTGGNFLNSYRIITKFFKKDPFYYQRVFQINFSYTKYHDENMGAMKQFELMRDMSELLLNIHGVSTFQDCSQTKEWLDLQRAILNAKEKELLQYNTERTDSGNYSNEDSVSESWKENQATIFQQIQENYSVALTLDSEKLREKVAEEMNSDSVNEYHDHLKTDGIQGVIADGISETMHGITEQVDKEERKSDNTFISPEPSHPDISSYHQQQEIYDLNQRNTPFINGDVQTIVSGISV